MVPDAALFIDQAQAQTGAMIPKPRLHPATVAVATTRNLLSMAEDAGIIPSAAALWSRIQRTAPTVNPASVLTVIEPGP